MTKEFIPEKADIKRCKNLIKSEKDLHIKIFYYLAIDDFDRARAVCAKYKSATHLKPIFIEKNSKYLEKIRKFLFSDAVFELVKKYEGMSGYCFVEDEYRAVINQLLKLKLPKNIAEALQFSFHYEYFILIKVNCALRNVEEPELRPGPASFHI